MKFVADLLPVILFVAVYHLQDIYTATAVAVGTAVVQILYLRIRRRPITMMQWVTLGLLVVFGGLTLLLHDPVFFKWKPTIVNWLFGGAFLVTPLISRTTLIQRLMGHAIRLPETIWKRLNLAWALFFLALGGINLYVAFGFEEAVWVNFKLFGLVGLTMLFAVAQAVYLSRHMTEAPAGEE